MTPHAHDCWQSETCWACSSRFLDFVSKQTGPGPPSPPTIDRSSSLVPRSPGPLWLITTLLGTRGQYSATRSECRSKKEFRAENIINNLTFHVPFANCQNYLLNYFLLKPCIYIWYWYCPLHSPFSSVWAPSPRCHPPPRLSCPLVSDTSQYK